MVLTEVQAQDILNAPKHSKQIKSAQRHESALRVFTEELDAHEIVKEIYWQQMTKVLKDRLSEKKYNRLMHFTRFPLPVTEITDSVLSDFYKVFDGKNRYFNIDGDRDVTRLEKWVTDINLEQWIEDNAREVFKNKPCSFIVIDRDNKGVPYPILIDSERLIDAQFKKGDDAYLEYIAFLHSIEVDETDPSIIIKRYAVYDDETFYVFRKTSNESAYVQETAVKHNVGYCPAMAFVCEKVNSKNKFKRRIAFGKSISKLEDWTFFDIYRNYVDHYAPFPVTESIKPQCKNPNCDDGYEKEEEIITEGADKGHTRIKKKPCTSCDGGKASQYIGPGVNIQLSYQMSNEINDGSGKFRMIFPDVDKLDYTPKKLNDLEKEVAYKTTGVDSLLTKEAVNELQAKGSFVSRDTILLRTKTILDKVYKFAVMTAGNMYYTNPTLKIDANHGTEWYLVSEVDLQQRFKEAKDTGLPINELTSIYKQLVETKYANNKSKRDQELLLIDIQDYPFYTVKECIEMANANAIDSYALSLKANFYNFVKRFERENGSITLFGNEIEYEKRVETIKQTLDAYNEELIKVQSDRGAGNTPPETPPTEE